MNEYNHNLISQTILSEENLELDMTETPKNHFLKAIENFSSSWYITYGWGENLHDE